MIVGVAGLPSVHFNRVQKIATRIFGTGQVFISTSLRPDVDGKYRPTVDHARTLLQTIAKRVETNIELKKHGCGIIVLTPTEYDVSSTLDFLASFSLLRTLPLPFPIETHGRKGDMWVNGLADSLRRATPPLVRAVNAMNVELHTRLNRTPLLLPLRNFQGRDVALTIERLSRDLPLADRPFESIAAACRQIEAHYPFGKVEGGASRCFTDDRKIEFRLPARAHHGMAASSTAPHDVRCYLNGGFRLGGFYEPGFHYDCRRDHSGGQRKHARPLKGSFSDCHGCTDSYTGRPHLNIAPNDFVRE